MDPAKVAEAEPEELAEVYELIKQVQGVMEVSKKEIGQMLLSKFEGNGTIFGQYGVSRVLTPRYTKVNLETARQFGAVKESIDGTILSKALKKGAIIEGVEYTESIRVSPLNKADEAEVQ